MTGNNFHSGKGIAFQLEREATKQHKPISVEKLDNGCDGYSARDSEGNRLDFPARTFSALETRHVKSMIRRLFGIVLAVLVLVLVMIVGSNFL